MMKKFKQYLKQSAENSKKLDSILKDKSKGYYGFDMDTDKVYWFESEKIYSDLTNLLKWTINPLETELEYLLDSGYNEDNQRIEDTIEVITNAIKILNNKSLIIGRSGLNIYLRLKNAHKDKDTNFINSVVKNFGVNI